MNKLLALAVLVFLVSVAWAQTDSNIIVFKHKIGKRQDTILKNDYLKIKHKNGVMYKGSFKKFKNGYIYTKVDTIFYKDIDFLLVNSYRRQKISSAYIAIGISGILNVAGFNAAFGPNRTDTLTETEILALKGTFTSGYTIMSGVLLTGVIMYNTYNRYSFQGREKKWDILLD